MNNASKQIAVRFSADVAAALAKKVEQTGMTNVDLVRLAVASFLARETALESYLEAIEGLDEKLVKIAKRQELFARAIGTAATLKDADRTPEIRQKMTDRFNQIIDTTGENHGDQI